MTAIDRMLHPHEARRIVLAHAQALPFDRVPLIESGGRVLAEALMASESLPPFPASTMDGFAVVHGDRSEILEIIDDGFAGTAPSVEVRPGTATRIMTGAPVPAGADAVVQVENTELADGGVRILQDVVRAGDNIRPVGSDMQAGELLLAAGTVLGPAEVGLLASLGHATVAVGRRPKVAVFSTGDELVEPGQTPGPGQIRDSNRFSLGHAAALAGADVIINRHVPDTHEAVRDALREALVSADAIITSGGVSMGDRDLVKALLGEFAEVHFRRVFMKPGKPLNFATAGERLIFGLPGNPVSCLVSFHMFVRPALSVMQGAPPGEDAAASVRLEHAVRPSDRIEYQRARVVSAPDGGLSASTTGSQQSARLMSFVGSNAFLVVPPGNEELPAGSVLDAILLAPPVAGT